MSITTNLYSKFISTETVEEDVFTQLEKERVEWSVPNVKLDNATDSTERRQINQCFSRIIALCNNLELPVGAFVRSLLEQENHIPKSALTGLIKNIEDEEKHQQAFLNVAKSYTVNPEDLKKANEYRKLLVKYNAHPLIKSRDLETILFIPLQTCLRYFGSQSLERLVGYISLDEYRHLQYGWELSDILGLGFDHEFENELVNICKWTFDPLRDTRLNNDFWLKTVDEMRSDGESLSLTDLMSYGISLAPFEISNNNY